MTMLPGPVLVTTPVPVEFVIVPVLIATKALTVLFAPLLLTAPEAVESAMLPTLAPTKILVCHKILEHCRQEITDARASKPRTR